MEATERAVVRLTEPHTELVDGRVGESGPLLEMLREARYPNLGGTKGGAGKGDVLDVQAMTMYENIDGIVRSWLNHYREHTTGDLIPLTRRLYQVLRTEDAGGRLEDRDNMFSMFPQWVAQIETFFDPPKVYELTVPCPECQAGRIPEGDEPREGERDERPYKWAMRVPVKLGHAVIAECHACGRMWAGRDDLTELAELTGVEVDWVKLRELTGDTLSRDLVSGAEAK